MGADAHRAAMLLQRARGHLCIYSIVESAGVECEPEVAAVYIYDIYMGGGVCGVFR